MTKQICMYNLSWKKNQYTCTDSQLGLSTYVHTNKNNKYSIIKVFYISTSTIYRYGKPPLNLDPSYVICQTHITWCIECDYPEIPPLQRYFYVSIRLRKEPPKKKIITNNNIIAKHAKKKNSFITLDVDVCAIKPSMVTDNLSIYFV